MDKNFDWNQIKIDAAINALNALVSNNSHNIIEEPIAKEIYPKIAVQYANHLVRALKNDFSKEKSNQEDEGNNMPIGSKQR